MRPGSDRQTTWASYLAPRGRFVAIGANADPRVGLVRPASRQEGRQADGESTAPMHCGLMVAERRRCVLSWSRRDLDAIKPRSLSIAAFLAALVLLGAACG